MIHWMWAVLAFIVGCWAGIFMVALLHAGWNDDDL